MITIIAAAIAVFYGLVALALAMLFAYWLRIPNDHLTECVTLVLPATGPLPGLQDLLALLAAQSLRPRRLIVAVESRDDPAYARVAALAEQSAELKIELVVAGLASLRSQKCTNLLAALAHLDREDEHVVLLDADIRPQPWWLAALVAPLAAGRADVVDGYRWPVPVKLSLGTVLVAGIDRAIAVLPRLRRIRSMWGGSLAVTRQALERLDLPNIIGRALTEDLPIGDRAAATELRVLTRRAVRPLSPLDGGLGELWRFGRRQYQLIRLYRPALWWFAALVVTTDLLARAALLARLPGSAVSLCAILALGCLGSAAVEIRSAIGRTLGAVDATVLRAAQHLVVWTFIPAPLFHASVIWSSLITSSVRWAHVRYFVDKTGRVLGVTRRPFVGARPASAARRRAAK